MRLYSTLSVLKKVDGGFSLQEGDIATVVSDNFGVRKQVEVKLSEEDSKLLNKVIKSEPFGRDNGDNTKSYPAVFEAGCADWLLGYSTSVIESILIVVGNFTLKFQRADFYGVDAITACIENKAPKELVGSINKHIDSLRKEFEEKRIAILAKEEEELDAAVSEVLFELNDKLSGVKFSDSEQVITVDFNVPKNAEKFYEKLNAMFEHRVVVYQNKLTVTF